MEHRDLVRVGLVHTLEVAGNNTVALAVASGGDLLGALRTGLAVELVLVEMELPEMNGFAVLAQLRERHEAVRVLMMGHRPGYEPLRRAIRQGAFTVLCTDCCEADLLKAVHDVQLTGNHFSDAVRAGAGSETARGGAAAGGPKQCDREGEGADAGILEALLHHDETCPVPNWVYEERKIAVV